MICGIDYPEKALAVSVISQCVKDIRQSRTLHPDDFCFLVGRTEISRFWFQLADLCPFSEKTVIEVFGFGGHF
jgi:hypothetical protein